MFSIKSIAIGSFDGIHLAHTKLIEQAQGVVVIERNGGYLTSGFKRSHFAKKPFFFYHFDKIKSLSPEVFVAKLKEDFPSLEKVVVGYDFSFGQKRAGNIETLKALFDGDVVVVDEVKVNGISVHSRTIKAYLQEGDIKRANTLLGRSYTIEGKVVRGQGLGSKALVATINLETKEYQLPKEGVYATKTFVDGIWHASVSFIGHRVSTDGSFAVETHLLHEQIALVSLHVSVTFIDFIRENQKFDTLSELKAQIQKDIATSKTILKGTN